MGDYFSLRFTAALTSEGAEQVRKLLRTHSWEGVNDAFAQMDRANFIPFGGLNYAPYGWEHARELSTVGPLETWHVCCSIKMSERTRGTVHYFLHRVLAPMLALPAKYELYAERSCPMENGLLMPSGEVLLVPETDASETS